MGKIISRDGSLLEEKSGLVVVVTSTSVVDDGNDDSERGTESERGWV